MRVEWGYGQSGIRGGGPRAASEEEKGGWSSSRLKDESAYRRRRRRPNQISAFLRRLSLPASALGGVRNLNICLFTDH